MNPYEVLGLNPGADIQQVKNAYKNLASKYQASDFPQGTPAAEHAKNKMEQINKAYDEIVMNSSNDNSYSSSSDYNYSYDYSGFSDIKNLIDNGRFDDAEVLLNGVSPKSRTAEWYYLKGTIMKRRGWLEQAYENFSQAYRMNPNKAEYKYAYENMNNSQYGGYRTRRRAEKNNNNGCTGDCGACDICSGLICADCCCECMGGDLISCC